MFSNLIHPTPSFCLVFKFTCKNLDSKDFNKDFEPYMKSDDLDSSQGVRYCTKCSYEAEDMWDLDAHTWSEHDEEDDSNLKCNFCDEVFEN